MFEFDPADEIHVRSLARLGTEQIAWLVTIGRDGYPHAVPIWFLWREGRALILSEPRTAKVANIRADARVALHLEAGDDGEQLTMLRGVATLHPDSATAWLEHIGDDYRAKYDDGLARLGLTAESMAERYSTVIEFTPKRLLAW
jgi:PPOX class probable F420-dependent enzyme